MHTFEKVNEAVAEPVVYMIDRYVVGGFYRVHTGRGNDENLNAPGMHFVPLAVRAQRHSRTAMPSLAPAVPNRFYMYGVVARLALAGGVARNSRRPTRIRFSDMSEMALPPLAAPRRAAQTTRQPCDRDEPSCVFCLLPIRCTTFKTYKDSTYCDDASRRSSARHELSTRACSRSCRCRPTRWRRLCIRIATHRRSA
ncbi:glutamate--cysteine ligase [Cupriavidus basilensis]